MDLGVGGVLELLGQEVARVGGGDLLRLADGAAHALGAGGEDQLGAVGAQEHAAFPAHRFRHGEDAFVAARGGDHGQGNAGVAAGGFDDDRVLVEEPLLFGRLDHGQPDAILDRVGGVEVLQLGDDLQPGCRQRCGSRRTSGVCPTSSVISL